MATHHHKSSEHESHVRAHPHHHAAKPRSHSQKSEEHHHKGGLADLGSDDLKLLKAAEGDQAKDDARRRARSAELHRAIHYKPHSGDWAPGMRSNALSELKRERAQAEATAKEAEADESYDSNNW
mmetsp:Transcript_67052/g.179227  ORF Transcript_67052/g.179227 Transcript_67052/m.179227 type:complete len:125 (+) Transcript_67052:533-907(+)